MRQSLPILRTESRENKWCVVNRAATGVRRISIRSVFILLVLVCHIASGRIANAFQPLNGMWPPQHRGGTTLPRNRAVERQFLLAEKLYEEGRVSAAIMGFQAVLDALEDSSADGFVRNSGDDDSLAGNNVVTVKQSLRTAVESTLQALPKSARDAYELQFGKEAAELLQRGLKDNNTAQLARAARQYFFTAAGQQAERLLAQLSLDAGDAFDATVRLNRLRAARTKSNDYDELTVLAAVAALRANQLRHAEHILQEFRNRKTPVTIFDREFPPAHEYESAIAWLNKITGNTPALMDHSWKTAGGNFQNTRPVQPVLFGAKRLWQQSTSTATDPDPGLVARLPLISSTVNKLLRQRPGDNLPAPRPLIVDDLVIFRSYLNLRAVRMSDGQLIWESATSDAAVSQALSEINNSRSLQSGVIQLLHRRMWQDLTSGTLTSNGRHVFAVEDPGATGIRISALSQHIPADHNILTAYDAKTGRAIWQLGSHSSQLKRTLPMDAFNPSQQLSPSDNRPPKDVLQLNATDFTGNFFLGPPLALGNRLYSLAEIGGQLVLQVLHPMQDDNTGEWRVEREWSLSLANVTRNIRVATERRLAGLTPAYDNGILYCPTCASAVIAVDLARRTPAWGFRYATSSSPQTSLRQNRNGFLIRTTSQGGYNWQDSAPRVTDEYVVMTPRDSSEIYCLNKNTGEMIWSQSRDKRMFVGAVDNKRVVVANRTFIEALDITTGKQVWKSPLNSAPPAGTGGISGDVYHQPLNDGSIASIDVESGRQFITWGSLPFGNLIAVGDRLVVQSPNTVTAWKNATASDSSPETIQEHYALAINALRRGKSTTAENALRTCLELDSKHEPSLALLRQSLFEGLRVDFQGNEKSVDELRTLIFQPRSANEFAGLVHRYTRSPIVGAHAVGREIVDWQRSAPDIDRLNRMQMTAQLNSGDVETALNLLLDMAVSQTTVTTLSPDHSVLTTQWIRSGLQQLKRRVGDERWPQLESKISRFVQRQPGTASVSDLWRLYGIFRDTSLAKKIRGQLLKDLDPVENDLQVSLLLRHAAFDASSSESAQKNQVIQAAHSLTNNRPIPARLQIASSAGVKDIQQLTADVAVAYGREIKDPKFLARQNAWPVDEFAAQRIPGFSQNTMMKPVFIPFESRDEYFRGWSFYATSAELLAFDETGAKRWGHAVEVNPQRLGSAGSNPASVSISNAGPLLLLERSGSVTVLNGYAKTKATRQLWRRKRSGVATFYNIANPFGATISKKAIIQNDYVAFRLDNTLVCVNTLTGENMWSRDDLSVDEIAAADDRYLLLKASDEESLRILNAVDGSTIGRTTSRTLTSGAHRVTDGRMLYLLGVDNEQRTLSKIDPVNNNEELWQIRFRIRSNLSAVKDNLIAIFEPTGRLRVIDLRSGKPVFERKLEPNPSLVNVSLFVQQDRVIVSTETQAGVNQRRAYSMTQFRYVVANGTKMCFDRTTGETLWEREFPRHLYMVDQSSSLPIMVLLRQSGGVLQLENRILPSSTAAAMEVIDTRTGKAIFTSPKVGMNYGSIVPEKKPGSIGILLSSNYSPRVQNSYTVLLGSARDINGAPKSPTETPPAKSEDSTPASEDDQD